MGIDRHQALRRARRSQPSLPQPRQSRRRPLCVPDSEIPAEDSEVGQDGGDRMALLRSLDHLSGLFVHARAPHPLPVSESPPWPRQGQRTPSPNGTERRRDATGPCGFADQSSVSLPPLEPPGRSKPRAARRDSHSEFPSVSWKSHVRTEPAAAAGPGLGEPPTRQGPQALGAGRGFFPQP